MKLYLIITACISLVLAYDYYVICHNEYDERQGDEPKLKTIIKISFYNSVKKTAIKIFVIVFLTTVIILGISILVGIIKVTATAIYNYFAK